MAESTSLLMLEFLAWVSSRQRTYAESMAAWQTTCPRHTIWEDALIEGFIRLESDGPQHESKVTLTPRGRTILDQKHGDNPERSAPPANSE